ncbi:MAG TPA: GH32 C-terminal domain-containing protein [Rubrivivax sp.]|nr:GH32 C-terminal domain-containing protein [Rubrivivax sp.]
MLTQAASIGRRLSRATGALACLLCLGCSAGSASTPAPSSPLLNLDFDRLAQGELPAGAAIRTQFKAPDVVPGVVGAAWRTDGFSSYAESSLLLDARQGFTLTLWVALESYPSDREVPVSELRPSSLAQQALGDAGFDLHIDAFGRWGFRVATADGVLRVAAPQRFPLRRWVHLAAVADPANGQVRLYQDRLLIGSASGRAGTSLRLAAAPFKLAVPPVEATILDFRINRINGAYDLVAVHPSPLSDEQLAQLPGPAAAQAPDATAALQVPESRFADDALRPRVHPLPPANWTNEPHGLTRVGDTWHLFYQRTPNGPFKTLMNWGHMSSQDLVTWTHLPDALRPELQTDTIGFDMKGIWSGHVFVDGGKAFAFYTSVNHGDRLAASNPGIAMAISEDAQLRDWRKTGPILNSHGLRDFRDPFVWKQGDTLHMIVGAALETGGGGLAYYTLGPRSQPPRWEMQARFTDPGYRALDPGSDIWEMPVFEQLSDQVWVLLVNPIGGRFTKYGEMATRAHYWTGEWSGGVFKPFFREPRLLDLVPGHLAPTVARAPDGRLRAIGIIDERRSPGAQLRAGWAHTFSLPRSWALMPDQRTLGQAPAPELVTLRGAPLLTRDAMAIGNATAGLGGSLHAYELQLDVDSWPVDAGALSIEVMASDDGREATRLVFDRHAGVVSVDLARSTVSGEREGPGLLTGRYDTQAFGPMSRLRVIVDGSVIQVFVNDAAAYGVRSYPSLATSTRVRASVAGSLPVTAGARLWPLRRPSG